MALELVGPVLRVVVAGGEEVRAWLRRRRRPNLWWVKSVGVVPVFFLSAFQRASRVPVKSPEASRAPPLVSVSGRRRTARYYADFRPQCDPRTLRGTAVSVSLAALTGASLTKGRDQIYMLASQDASRCV